MKHNEENFKNFKTVNTAVILVLLTAYGFNIFKATEKELSDHLLATVAGGKNKTKEIDKKTTDVYY